jgi:CheY-like chemotaxis protein
MVAQAIEGPKATPSVLVVEDNRDIRDSLLTLLGLLGHPAEAAADGAEGVRRALALRPRLAMVDLGLPRLDGFEVARQLRAALGSDILLVAYTAYGDAESKAQALDAGFDMHFVKPLNWDQFAPWLDETLGAD